MNPEFTYTRETQITQEMNDVLTCTFLRNPTLGEKVFDSDRQSLSSLMHLCLLYYNRFGIIYSLRDSDNKIVALTLWSASESPSFDIIPLLTRGFFLETIKCILTIGFKRLKKLLYFSGINDKHHIKEPHYYLVMLASIKKGSGRILLNNCIDIFRGHTLYWESSVAKDNHAYYKSFGAEMIGQEMIYGQSNAYFVLRPNKADAK